MAASSYPTVIGSASLCIIKPLITSKQADMPARHAYWLLATFPLDGILQKDVTFVHVQHLAAPTPDMVHLSSALRFFLGSPWISILP